MRHALVPLLFLAACKSEAPPAAPSSASPAAAKTATAAPSAKPDGLVGNTAPDFSLTGLGGESVKLSALRGKVVVLEWFNPDCPFVKNAHNIGTLKGMAKKVREEHPDVVWLAINSGAEGKQGHGENTNRAGKDKFGIDYPILFDANGKVGRAYGATNTPHMYVIDKEGTVRYAGALDNTGSGDPEDASPVVSYVADALADLAAGREVRTPETKAWGCSVKYASR